MAQKVIDIVGSSKQSFAKAAENAVAEAAKTVRGMKWARVDEWGMTSESGLLRTHGAGRAMERDLERQVCRQ